MSTCNDCIHKDVCYLIEHYGRDLCSDDACDKFLATPVFHGYWIEIQTHNGCTPDYDCVCSICGESGMPVYNFCPNCGAKNGR